MLKTVNLPIAAPSANLSGRMSATSAKEVVAELGGRIGFVLDGGKSEFGIESTVVDVTGEYPVILRPGAITKEMIELVAGKTLLKAKVIEGEKIMSPGQKYRHYSPSVPVFVGQYKDYVGTIKFYNEAKKSFKTIIVCTKSDSVYFKGCKFLVVGNNTKDFARKIYSTLRKLEKKYEYIIISSVIEQGIGSAINNRIQKMNIKN